MSYRQVMIFSFKGGCHFAGKGHYQNELAGLKRLKVAQEAIAGQITQAVAAEVSIGIEF